MSLWIIYTVYIAVILSVQKAGGYEFEVFSQCLFSSKDIQNTVYIDTYIYNKVELIRFNSTKGVFEGYTQIGISNAKKWNEDPTHINPERDDLEHFCKQNANTYTRTVLDKLVKPFVILKSVTPSSGRHPSMLMCSAYNFYPKQITVKWLRDGQPMTSDVTSTEEMADGDWYYQVHSHLEYTPKSGEKISCVVEHPSLEKAIVEDWDPSMPEAERNKIAIGASGLVLGLVLALAGFLYYKRKATGRILVPTN